ncbi:uncharacterized protein LOC111519116 [Drosophila willistoni]|uniref:uncharacterized protein LOC111519116 n=1 Tax=Drosophila willistoni TaxID=7260 RepID=UPI001F071D43|nr:uncharacterized protein LOC111519116 [Drosophila willistoni]
MERGHKDLRYKLINKMRNRYPPRDAREIINKKIARRRNRRLQNMESNKHHVSWLYAKDKKLVRNHDDVEMFDLSKGSLRTRIPEGSSFQISISNLSYAVTIKDVHDLFSKCGPIIHASLVSPGKAVVVFDKHSEAVDACKAYNMRNFENRVMILSLHIIQKL